MRSMMFILAIITAGHLPYSLVQRISFASILTYRMPGFPQ